ncbi:MAG TPA: RNA 2',3'-cyclic phosphodiesterase [Candidatus Cybelea sp.]|jgi:2'-5' RNA ligase|nr:RNA 2',3'-cyclic phosphodiesterase [Candidatus Cybelea sp.]
MAESAPRKRRLFVGIELRDAARADCTAVSGALLRTGFAAHYEAPEKLHVTLAFLGFVEASRCDAVAEALEGSASRSAPVTVTLDKLGAFPHERRPRVVYIGAREQGAAFRALAREVRVEYANLGFVFDNDPVAHVTIARVKERGAPLPMIEFAPISLDVGRLALFESLPDPEHKTSRYEVLTTAPLDTTVSS